MGFDQHIYLERKIWRYEVTPLEQFKKEISADWPKLNTSLAKYANKLLMGKYLSRGTLPEGFTIEDLILQAVQKTLEGLLTSNTGKGLRKWNPAKVSLYNFLCGVIRSDMWSLVTAKDNQNHSLDEQVESSDETNENAFLTELEIELSKSKGTEKALQIFNAMEKLAASSADISSQNIRDITGMSDSEYKNAKAVFDRTVTRLKEGMS